MRGSVVSLASLALVVVVAGGCGEEAPTPPAGAPVAGEQQPDFPGSDVGPDGPAAPPPSAPPGVRSAPPPAWIETQGGKTWLAFSSYCWDNTCIEARPADQRRDIPDIVLQPGETVRFHLQFTPSSLELTVGDAAYDLQADKRAQWAVRGPGGLAQLATSVDGKSADYVARFVVR